MNFFEVNLLLCALSLGGMILIVGRRVRLAKGMNENELYRGIYTSKPFFGFVGSKLSSENIIEWARAIKKRFKVFFPEIRSAFLWTKGLYCKFLDRMHGRKLIKSNGCKGYWEKINESKNRTVKK